MEFENALSNDTTPTETLVAETQVDDKSIVVNVTVPAVEPSTPPAVVDNPEDSGPAAPLAVPYSTFTLDATAPSAPSAMSSVVTSVFGEYQGKTQTVNEVLADGTAVSYQQYVPGLAGLDWPWLAGVLLFSLLLWSFCRMVGVLLQR